MEDYLIFSFFFRQLAIRPFSSELKTIAKNIECFLIEQYNSDKTVVLKPFTTATIITYLNQMKLPEHKDQIYKNDGSFDQSQNSQLENTITAILCFGDTRWLDFSLHKRTHRTIQKVCYSQSFELSHGTLFVLHPQDEVPLVRKLNEKDEQTFFKHSSKGIKGGGGMSLGIVFRSTVSLCEVNKKTGCLLHSCEKEQTEKDRVLLDYCSSENKKIDEKELESKWKQCEEKNLNDNYVVKINYFQQVLLQ